MEEPDIKTSDESSRPATERALRPDHGFVVQFEANASLGRGRVEHVVSGRATRFATLEELLVFLSAVLRETAVKTGEAQ